MRETLRHIIICPLEEMRKFKERTITLASFFEMMPPKIIDGFISCHARCVMDSETKQKVKIIGISSGHEIPYPSVYMGTIVHEQTNLPDRVKHFYYQVLNTDNTPKKPR